MTRTVTRLPVLAELPLAHLTIRISAVPGGGLSFGLMTSEQIASGSGVEVCGFADESTAAELRRIADTIEARS